MTEILAAQDTSIGPAGGRKNADVTAWVAVAAGALGAMLATNGTIIAPAPATPTADVSAVKNWRRRFGCDSSVLSSAMLFPR